MNAEFKSVVKGCLVTSSIFFLSIIHHSACERGGCRGGGVFRSIWTVYLAHLRERGCAGGGVGVVGLTCVGGCGGGIQHFPTHAYRSPEHERFGGRGGTGGLPRPCRAAAPRARFTHARGANAGRSDCTVSDRQAPRTILASKTPSFSAGGGASAGTWDGTTFMPGDRPLQR